MKKLLLSLSMIVFIASTNVSMAQSFDTLQNLTPSQKQKLTQFQFNYKNQINALDTRIMDYQNKLAKVQADVTKTQEQIALLKGAYERNIATLEEQKKQLEDAMNNSYKAVMTPDQFKQYSVQQMQVQDSFSQFVRTAK